MEHRNIYSRSIYRDPELTAVLAYCINELRSYPDVVRRVDKTIELQPYEVLIEFEQIDSDLKMKRETFFDKMKALEDMKRVTLRSEKDYLRVLFLGLSFPIGDAQEIKQPNQDIPSIKLDRWIEIELALMEFSKDYFGMTRQVLRRFQKIIGNKNIDDVDLNDFKEWQTYLKNGGTGNVSINNYRRVLNASFNRAIEKGYLKENPLARSKPLPAIKRQPEIVERDEVRLLFDAFQEPWLKFVVEFALLSVKRHGEILNLKKDDVDRRKKTISIHSTEEYRVKFGKSQVLALSTPLEKLLDEIEEYHRKNCIESDHLFVDESGKHLTEPKVRKAFNNARDLAGLEKHVTMHAMRRTGATMMKQRGATTNTIKGILNHGDEKVTNRYLGVPKDDEKKALDLLEIADFLGKNSETA
jgi:integrase